MIMKRVAAFENENISSEMVKSICDDLHRNALEMLSFRNCVFTDKDYKRVMKAVGSCTSLSFRHLGLHVNILCDKFRIQVFAQMIQRNASMVGLHLHGNNLGDNGFETIYQPLKTHPRLLTLDLSDCNLGDKAMDLICTIVKESNETAGLHNLTISHNPSITSSGWIKLSMALASGSMLRSLDIDYNYIEDSSACCLATALPGSTHLETLDIGYTKITEITGQVLLQLVKSYNLKLKSINMEGTRILESTKEAILLHLFQTHPWRKNDHSSEDECSLAMSEPPLIDTEEDLLGVDGSGTSNRKHSVDTYGIPVVEISPAVKQVRAPKCSTMDKLKTAEGTRSMSDITKDGANLNAAGFEIKKAFSLTYLSEKTKSFADGSVATAIEMNNSEGLESYSHEAGSLRQAESDVDIEKLEDIDQDDWASASVSIYSVKGLDETDDTSKSGNLSPLFQSRPMSAPMSGKNMKNKSRSSDRLLHAKSTVSSAKGPVDLAALIQQRKGTTDDKTDVVSRTVSSDMQVQEII